MAEAGADGVVTVPESHREALVAFFEVHNPSSVPKIDKFLALNKAPIVALAPPLPQARADAGA